MENQKKEESLQENKSRDSAEKINTVTELVRICLKSISFDLLFILMVGYVWNELIILRQSTEGQDSTAALRAIFVCPFLVGIFFLAIFMSMLSLTRKRKKNIYAIVLFALATLLIPIFMIFYFPLSIPGYSGL